MAFKRQIDRLPIIPADAKKQNVVCHFCIVGCGYHAYTWPVNRQGGTDPAQNVFKTDLSKQQAAETDAWYAPSMYNIVQQNGQDVHIVIKPDKACEVNSGLGSIRGARMAEMSYSRARGDAAATADAPDGVALRADAADLVGRRARPRGARDGGDDQGAGGEDNLFVSAFDHGGAGGGYENTWGTGKLYFEAMKVKNIRIHNRPAYNSEVHATRDMGVGELNNCYEDAELADTIFAVGTNAYETQTNYFLNHWVPNLRGTSMRQEEAAARRRTACAARASSSSIRAAPRRLRPARPKPARTASCISPSSPAPTWRCSTRILTHIAEKGWQDKAFIAASTKDFDKALAANKTSLADAAAITGLSADDIAKAAAWIAEPKDGQAPAHDVLPTRRA